MEGGQFESEMMAFREDSDLEEALQYALGRSEEFEGGRAEDGMTKKKNRLGIN